MPLFSYPFLFFLFLIGQMMGCIVHNLINQRKWNYYPAWLVSETERPHTMWVIMKCHYWYCYVGSRICLRNPMQPKYSTDDFVQYLTSMPITGGPINGFSRLIILYRRLPILLPFWSENRILTTVRITEILTRWLLTGTANSSDIEFHTNMIVDSQRA